MGGGQKNNTLTLNIIASRCLAQSRRGTLWFSQSNFKGLGRSTPKQHINLFQGKIRFEHAQLNTN